jgi:hypothetical protein
VALTAGLYAAVLFLRQRVWVWPLVVGLAALGTLLFFIFVQPSIGLRLLLVAALFAGVWWARRSSFWSAGTSRSLHPAGRQKGGEPASTSLRPSLPRDAGGRQPRPTRSPRRIGEPSAPSPRPWYSALFDQSQEDCSSTREDGRIWIMRMQSYVRINLVALALALIVGCGSATATPESPAVSPVATPSARPTEPLDISPIATPSDRPAESPAVSPIATPGAGSGAAPTRPGGGPAAITGLAPVESIDLLLMESFPLQVQVLVRGYLPDGCTQIDQIEQVRTGNVFRIQITTTRPADKMCTQIVVPFEESIPLDVVGLPAGTYTVDVNGVTASFTLDVDNQLPEATP